MSNTTQHDPNPFTLHSVRHSADIYSKHETLFDAVRSAHTQDQMGTASPGYITYTDPSTGRERRWDKQWINNCKLEHICDTCREMKPRVRSIVVAGYYGDRVERICSDCDLSLRRALLAADAEGNDMVRQESADGVVTIKILPHSLALEDVKDEVYAIFLHLVKPTDDDNPDVATATDIHISVTAWGGVLDLLEQHEIDVIHMWKPANPVSDDE